MTDLQAVSTAFNPGRLPVTGLLALAGSAGALFSADRRTLAGLGTAAVLELPGGLQAAASVAAFQAQLAAIPHHHPVDRPGGRVTALATLPFDRSAAGRFLVPRLTIGFADDGTAWATLVTDHPGDATSEALEADLAAVLAQAAEAGGDGGVREVGGGVREVGGEAAGAGAGAGANGALPTLTENPPGSGYADAVAAAVADIRAGALQKVVLAREVDARFAHAPDLGQVVGRLRANEPSCTTFSVPVPGGRFLGASPELLVRREGRAVVCHPLAGTVGLSGDPVADEQTIDRFLGSAKDRGEHRLVVDMIAAYLKALCTELAVPAEPSLVRLHSVAHLGTLVQGILREDRSVLELLAALHPTPAVGGVPRQPALDRIATLEATPRGHWAGPVGWVDAAGDGEWMIGIRSATVEGRLARLHGGAGIVAGSEPAAELLETTVKLVPALDALAPGASALL